MKTDQFRKLLNLYIDGELEPSTASELEHEILANPAHRRIYDEYCRIHRATKMVYDRFRNAAPPRSPDEARTFHSDVQAPFERRSSGLARWGRVHYFAWAGAGAAACLSLFVFYRGTQTGAQPIASTGAAAPAAAQVSAASETIPAPFAGEMRIDPYLTELPALRPNPFSAVSFPEETPQWTLEVGRGLTPSMSGTPEHGRFGGMRYDPTFGQPEPRSGVFRSSNRRPQVQLEPVGYQIHR